MDSAGKGSRSPGRERLVSSEKGADNSSTKLDPYDACV